MKRLLVLAVATVFALSGCAGQSGVLENSSSPSVSQSSTTSPTPTKSIIPDPGDTATGDPNAGTGATPSDGKGDPLARTVVLWIDYPAGTQADIDAQTAAGDCKSLDSQYGGAKANESTVKAASGHGAEAILAYINEARALAGCS